MNEKLEKLRILSVLLAAMHSLSEPLLKTPTVELMMKILNSLGFQKSGFSLGLDLLHSATDESITPKAFSSMCFVALDNMIISIDNIRCAGEGSLVVLNTKACIKQIREKLYVSI